MATVLCFLLFWYHRWLYVLSDAAGDGRVIEAGPADPNCTSVEPNACPQRSDYRDVVRAENKTFAELLPSPQYLKSTLGELGVLTTERQRGVRYRWGAVGTLIV